MTRREKAAPCFHPGFWHHCGGSGENPFRDFPASLPRACARA